MHPPCILLHGDINALSIARSLGRRGVPVLAVNDPSEVGGGAVLASRHVRPLCPASGTSDELTARWADHLLGPATRGLEGAVLLACSDLALRLIASHRAELQQRYLLDLSDPVAQLRVLDKRASLEIARDAGVAHPRFWLAGAADELDAVARGAAYPLLVKPVDTHRFLELTGHKMLVVNAPDELREATRAVAGEGLDFVLVELLPGPDDLLCSYYTYLDEQGRPEFHFTKRVVRRHPKGFGPACYHVTSWEPETARAGLRFLRAAGVRGLGNVEFKLDRRDGRLKLIECNARFTAGNPLLVAAGYDLGWYVYQRVTGGTPEPLGAFRSGLHLWRPVLDARAMLELRRSGELSVPRWLRSVSNRQVLAWFASDDLRPSLAVARQGGRRAVERLRRARDGRRAHPGHGR